MSIASQANGHKLTSVHDRQNSRNLPKSARWTARPSGQPVEGVAWGRVEILDLATGAWVPYSLIINGEGEELVLEPTLEAREAGHRRVVLCAGGSECSCGDSDPKNGCVHQRALRYLFQNR